MMMAKGVSGKARGKAEGKISNAIKVVKNLLAKGFSLEEALAIADIDQKPTRKNSRNKVYDSVKLHDKNLSHFYG